MVASKLALDPIASLSIVLNMGFKLNAGNLVRTIVKQRDPKMGQTLKEDPKTMYAKPKRIQTRDGQFSSGSQPTYRVRHMYLNDF